MAVNIKNTIDTLANWEEKIVDNKVTNFAYTQEAYDNIDYVDGVEEYDVSAENNIPVSDADVIKVNETIVSKGFRSKASSLTRMLINHIFGRVSYNLNKIHDNFQALLTVLQQGFHPVYFGTCASLSNASVFSVICTDFVLETGARIFVKFTNEKSPENETFSLNVNATGAKTVQRMGVAIQDNVKAWQSGEIVEFYYDGTYWQLMKPLFTDLANGTLCIEF